MAANTINNLVDYFTHTQDPRAADPGQLDLYYRPRNGAPAPNALFDGLTTANEPLVFLALDATMSHPIPLVLPFTTDVLGDPNATGIVYAMVGDRGPNNAWPSVVQLANTCFHRVQNVAVPTQATIQAAWQAHLAGENPGPFLPLPDADTEQVTVRHLVNVPHIYRADVLARFNRGELTNEYLITEQYQNATPADLAAYPGYYDWIRSITTSPGDDGAGDPLRPAAGMAFLGVFGNVRAAQQVPVQFGRWCPGVNAPHTLQASLTTLTNQQQQIAHDQHAITTNLNRQSATKTLYDFDPILCENVQKVSQQSDPTALPRCWRLLPNTQKKSVLMAFQTAFAPSDGTSPVLLSAQFVNDLVSSKWTATTNATIDERFLPRHPSACV